MIRISPVISESLSEYIILTNWVTTKPEDVSLQTKLGDSIVLQYPYMTARMQCVVGPEMAIAAGRNGILTCIPRSLRDINKQKIIDANNNARLKEGNIEYVTEPEHIELRTGQNPTLEDTVELVNRTGYSVIPILDWHKRLRGFYIHDPDRPPPVPPSTSIEKIMIPLKTEKNKQGISVLYTSDNAKIKRTLSGRERKFVPIVNKNNVLQKLAFLQKYDTNFIGIAITTREKWKEELEKWGPQVDTLMIDSSNACFDDAIKILKAAKKRFPDKPFGIGNIIQGRDFTKFAGAGADYIIGGMGVGSICQTGSERGNGRGQFTVAKELAEARDSYKSKYIPLVIDGGIRNKKDMVVALALGDLIMMGNYFNRFLEAAARKLDINQGLTPEEAVTHYVETWGEGHPKARLVAMLGLGFEEVLKNPEQRGTPTLERYGHSAISNATIEGVAGIVEYRGRLKPCVENDARYIRTTISNTGASDLASFREKAILEKISPRTLGDLVPHNLEIIE